MSEPFEIVRSEASYWWRTNAAAGAILHRSMLLFIAVPVILVVKGYTLLSMLVFGAMLPYGLLLERLARQSVAKHIREHPEVLERFEEEGIITR